MHTRILFSLDLEIIKISLKQLSEADDKGLISTDNLQVELKPENEYDEGCDLEKRVTDSKYSNLINATKVNLLQYH